MSSRTAYRGAVSSARRLTDITTLAEPVMLTHMPFSVDTGSEGMTEFDQLDQRFGTYATGLAHYTPGSVSGGTYEPGGQRTYWQNMWARWPDGFPTLEMPQNYNEANLTAWAAAMPTAFTRDGRAEYAPKQEPEDNIWQAGTYTVAEYLAWCNAAVAALAGTPIKVVHELQSYAITPTNLNGPSWGGAAKVAQLLVPGTTGIGWSEITRDGSNNLGQMYADQVAAFHATYAPEKEIRMASLSLGVPDGTPAISSIRQTRANNIEIAIDAMLDIGAKAIGYYDLRFNWGGTQGWWDHRIDDYSLPVMLAAKARLAALPA